MLSPPSDPRVAYEKENPRAFSERCVRDLGKPPHPVVPKTLFRKGNPTFDHSLDEDLLYILRIPRAGSV